MNTDAKKILQDAYDVLEARGWCQGSMTSDGKVCLEGAIRAACNLGLTEADFEYTDLYSDLGHRAAWELLCGAVREESGDESMAPYAWNDAPERTVEDVKLMLKRAIHGE